MVVGCKKIEIYVRASAETNTFCVHNVNISEIRVVNMHIYVIDGSNLIRNRVNNRVNNRVL